MSSEIDSILTRLRLCQADIGTITTARKEPPREMAVGELPLSYAVQSGVSDLPTDPISDVQIFTFTIEVLVTYIGDKNVNASTISQAVVSTHAIIDDMVEYYRNHRTLSTNTLAPLNGIYTDETVTGIRFSSPGLVVPLTAHDVKDYIGTRFEIRVPMLIETEVTY